MRDAQYSRAQVVRYLAWTFGLAYAVQIGAAWIMNRGNRTAGQLIVAAMMFVPTLGAALAGARLRDMGWRPQIRKNLKALLFAWFAPAALTAVGAGLYFLVFPDHFDLSGSYVASSVGAEAFRQLEAQGVSYSQYALVTAVSSVTLAPLINALLALGEEIGWRGFLYPQLKARFGRRAGWLLGGVIWGAWHWPLIWLIGYEYGAAAGNATGYFGFPVVGMLLFCGITVGWGLLHDRLYEKTGSLWAPALFHGAINAAATFPLSVCRIDTGSARLLGPAANGLLAGLPFLAVAAVAFVRAGRER